MLTFLAPFNHRKVVDIAVAHGMPDQGLCLGLSSKWCSLADSLDDTQAKANTRSASDRLRQLEGLDIIKPVATEQQLLLRKLNGMRQRFSVTVPVTQLLIDYLASNAHHAGELDLVERAYADFSEDILKSQAGWRKAIVSKFFNGGSVLKLSSSWRNLPVTLAYPGAAVLVLHSHNRQNEIEGHAVGVFTRRNGQTLFFDANVGETLADDMTDAMHYIKGLKQRYDPSGVAEDFGGPPFIFTSA